MSVIVAGFVKNGVVVPNAPLPEGGDGGAGLSHAALSQAAFVTK